MKKKKKKTKERRNEGNDGTTERKDGTTERRNDGTTERRRVYIPQEGALFQRHYPEVKRSADCRNSKRLVVVPLYIN